LVSRRRFRRYPRTRRREARRLDFAGKRATLSDAPEELTTSKAFTSEETPDAPLIVPARAPLPDGVPNYVTARGLALLRAEAAELDAERRRLGGADEGDEAETARRRSANAIRLRDVNARIAGAVLVDPRAAPGDRVRFGVTVSLAATGPDGETSDRRYTIVGVDEAEPAAGRIAFTAPLARAVIGLRVGDVATLRTGRGEETLEVTAIDRAEP
jgi:transcription elongation factor GreB